MEGKLLRWFMTKTTVTAITSRSYSVNSFSIQFPYLLKPNSSVKNSM